MSRREKAELTRPPRGHQLDAYRTLATVPRSIGTDQGMNGSKPTWDESRTRQVPKSSFSKHTLLPCSLMLTVRACDFTCRGEAREGQVRRGPDPQTRTCPHRSDSTQQERMSCRRTDAQ